MRPYLTILRDSFHEALASRVLWMILIVITILLLFIAPLGLRGLEGWQLHAVEVFDPPALAKAILDDAQQETPTVGKHLLAKLPQASRARLEKIAGEKALVGAPQTTAPGSDADWLAQQLNPLLARADFYDAEAFKKVRLRSEARKTRKAGLEQLDDEERLRFNRLAFEAAYAAKVAMLENREVRLAYFGWTPEGMPPAERSFYQGFIANFIFLMLKFGVGVAGVLAGLFVTSTIIPQTFEAGAVDLLFSKPVTRSGVYITKFLGGCTFVLIMAAYFVGGIWLLAGWRFDLWNGYLLATIPVFVFIFGVYYSVCCLAGAYWRNPIVSVTIAAMLWGFGWVVFILNQFADAYVLVPQRILKIVWLDDQPMSVAELGEVRVWDAPTNSWQEVFKPPKPENMAPGIRKITPFAGPVYDSSQKRIVAIDRFLPSSPQISSSGSILIGQEKEHFLREVALNLPQDALDADQLLRESDGNFLVVSSSGVRRWRGEVEEQQAPATTVAGFDLSGLLPSRGENATSDALTLVSPSVPLERDYQAALHPQNGELALLDESALYFCRRGEDGKYVVRLEAEVDLDRIASIAYAGDTLLVALEDQRVLAFKAADGKPRDELRLPGESAAGTMFASPDGKTFALLARNRYAYLYEPEAHALEAADVAGQGSITSVAMDGDGRLLVADRTDRVTVYALPGLERVARFQPSRSWYRFAYDFLLYPLYRVTPKPRELDQLTQSLISDLDQTRNKALTGDADIVLPQETSRWTPVRDNGLFILFMLVIGCWYVSRRDF